MFKRRGESEAETKSRHDEILKRVREEGKTAVIGSAHPTCGTCGVILAHDPALQQLHWDWHDKLDAAMQALAAALPEPDA